MKRILAFAAIAAASFVTPAVAQDAAAERVHVVGYGDLDLGKQADLQKLDRRLALAAREVCGATSDFDPAGKNGVRRCRQDLMARLTAERERAIASRGVRRDIVVAVRER